MLPARAVILAAGQSVRLRPLTDSLPKCLLPMGPKTILDWQLEALQSIGVEDITLVVGYFQEKIKSHVSEHYPNLHVTYVTNEDYVTTNTLFSLKMALEQVEQDFYYLNADVVFDEEIVKRLAPHQNGGFLAIDCKQCREEEVKVTVDGTQVLEIGKHLNPDECYGEFIGVAKFSGDFVNLFRETVFNLATPGNEMKFFEYALDALADKSRLITVDITGLPCVEVDFVEDYEYAVNQVLTTFMKADSHE
jgi:choline kinase